MSRPSDDWNDFDWFVNTYIEKQTMPILRQFADAIYAHAQVNVGLRSGEKKAEMVAKLQHAFTIFRQHNDVERYKKARLHCEQAGRPQYQYAYTPTAPPIPTFGGVPSTSNGSRYPPPARPPASNRTSYVPQVAASRPNGSNGSGSGWGQASASSTLYNRPNTSVLQDWKPSPMWKPIKAFTSMDLLPDITANESSHTRRDKKVTFTIDPDSVAKLEQSRNDPSSKPHYSLRLFCVSNENFRPQTMPINAANSHITNQHIPIEYPSNPEAYLDGSHVPFKERGLRGKPGSAPPVDLGKSLQGLILAPGRMTSVTMGHAGPTTGKKKDVAKRFWFQVVLAEITTKEELLERLKKTVPTPAAAALAMTRTGLEDDDIELGASVMSLKDPLSYMRLQTPVRSSKCRHIQCFEAVWWMEANANHPQWLCPKCSKELKFDDLIVDGYVLDILNNCSEDVDDVILEPGGEWHTEDNKFGSATWLATHAAAGPSVNGTNKETAKLERKPSIAPTPTPTPESAADSPNTKGKRKAIEILSSDSEEEQPSAPNRTNGNGHHHRPTPSTVPPSSRITRTPSAQPNNTSAEPIDLTLSSDDEAPLRPPPRHTPASGSGFRQPGVGQGSTAIANATESRVPPLSQIPITSTLRPNSPLFSPPANHNPNRSPSAGFGFYSSSGFGARQNDTTNMYSNINTNTINVTGNTTTTYTNSQYNPQTHGLPPRPITTGITDSWRAPPPHPPLSPRPPLPSAPPRRRYDDEEDEDGWSPWARRYTGGGGVSSKRPRRRASDFMEGDWGFGNLDYDEGEEGQLEDW